MRGPWRCPEWPSARILQGTILTQYFPSLSPCRGACQYGILKSQGNATKSSRPLRPRPPQPSRPSALPRQPFTPRPPRRPAALPHSLRLAAPVLLPAAVAPSIPMSFTAGLGLTPEARSVHKPQQVVLVELVLLLVETPRSVAHGRPQYYPKILIVSGSGKHRIATDFAVRAMLNRVFLESSGNLHLYLLPGGLCGLDILQWSGPLPRWCTTATVLGKLW